MQYPSYLFAETLRDGTAVTVRAAGSNDGPKIRRAFLNLENEIGMIHWIENNTTIHHGRAGLHALGFTPGKDIDQITMDYVFDDHAKALSRAALKQQLPGLIYEAADSDMAPLLEQLFGIRCNDTPVVRELLEEVLISLRGERELIIVDETGREKPRANTIEWTDRIKLPAQRSFFGPLSKF